MAELFKFLSRNYTATPLDIAKKRVRGDAQMQRVLEILDTNPEASPEQIAAVLGYHTDANGNVIAGQKVTPTIVGTRHIPYAKRLLQEARDTAALVPTQSSAPEKKKQSASEQSSDTEPLVIDIPGPNGSASDGKEAITLDDIEQETLRLVANAGNNKTLEKRLRRFTVSFFKTFGPFMVLALTIPETVWVFTHIYTVTNWTLILMTWIFSVVLDFGFLAITNMLADNKENLTRKQIRNQVIQAYERRIVARQSAAWWVVAALDSGSQLIFLIVATWGSHLFPVWLTFGLSGGRVLDLGIVMWVVSFAGMELTTKVEEVVSERLEMAEGIKKVSAATDALREAQQEARIHSEQRELDLQRDREEAAFLARLRRDSFTEIHEMRDAMRGRHKQIEGPDDDEQSNKLP